LTLVTGVGVPPKWGAIFGGALTLPRGYRFGEAKKPLFLGGSPPGERKCFVARGKFLGKEVI